MLLHRMLYDFTIIAGLFISLFLSLDFEGRTTRESCLDPNLSVWHIADTQ